MIELLIAIAVLVFGFTSLLALITTAIASNGRNKTGSTGMMLTQAVVEQINSTLIGAGSAALTDCAGHNWTIDTATGGADLSGANIDFSQTSPPADYHMDFAICSGAVQTIYDVRWNVQPLTSGTYLVTVGARLKGSGHDLKYYALPVNLRTYVGP